MKIFRATKSLEDILLWTVHYIAVSAIIIVTALSFFQGNLKFLLPFYVITGHLSLSAFIFLKNRKSRINISFSMTTVFMAIWTLSIFMYTQAITADDALLWSKTATAVSSLIPVFFVYFTSVFPKEERKPGPITVLIWLAIGVTFFILSFSSLMVKGVVSTISGFQFVPGPALILFMIHFISFTLIGFYFLFKKHREYSGINRMQIRYVLAGFILGSFFPIVTNIILPILGVVEFSGYGPFSTLITICFIAYAIVKHRLMSVELVMQKGLVYGAITAFILSLYALSIILSERIFRETIGYSSFIITGSAAVIIALLYQPLLRFFQDSTDKLFFKRHYDYQKTLKEVSSAIALLIRLDQLTQLIVSTFAESILVSEISFLLYDKTKKRYKSASVKLKGASRYRRMEIDEVSPIIKHLKETNAILIEDELENEVFKIKPGPLKDSLSELEEELASIGVPIWVPIISKDELVGVIASGNKLSGDVFTIEDLGLISTLASQTAVALDNVRLYEEILQIKTYNEDILKSMTNGVMTTDMQGKIIKFNVMAEKITGQDSGKVIGSNVTDVWSDGIISGAVLGTLRGGNYSNYDANLIKEEGEIIPVSISTTLLKDNFGKKVGVLAVISDLSEVKELEGKVRQADKLAALGTMAAGMAHEIKNPLSSMKVLSQLMPIKFEDEQFRKRFIDIMPREISRIDRIVESLLGFARATAPKFEMVNIAKIIEETLSYFEDDIERRKIKIIKDYSSVPDVTGDFDQLTQVFSNLILNAIQAMPESGELNLKIREGKKKDGVVEQILIEVSDTGHGIPKEYLKKLFDPFFTTKHGGTGLGLTIAHSIIDGHRGGISVESTKEKGTKFNISLPIKQ